MEHLHQRIKRPFKVPDMAFIFQTWERYTDETTLLWHVTEKLLALPLVEDLLLWCLVGDLLCQVPAGGSILPTSRGGSTAPSSRRGSVAPSSRGGSVAPSSHGGSVAPSSCGGSIAPSFCGGSIAPDSRSHSVVPTSCTASPGMVSGFRNDSSTTTNGLPGSQSYPSRRVPSTTCNVASQSQTLPGTLPSSYEYNFEESQAPNHWYYDQLQANENDFYFESTQPQQPSGDTVSLHRISPPADI